jgi:hypothetical protein
MKFIKQQDTKIFKTLPENNDLLIYLQVQYRSIFLSKIKLLEFTGLVSTQKMWSIQAKMWNLYGLLIQIMK